MPFAPSLTYSAPRTSILRRSEIWTEFFILFAHRSTDEHSVPMSGFEIVGLVLGGLPLAIEATKGLESYLKGIKAAWLFRRHFKEFIRAVTIEEIFFTQNIDLLLAPLDLSDNERQALKDSQTSNLWHHPDIVDKIRQHHKEALPVCTRLLRELDDSLKALYKVLPIKNGKVSTLL